MYDIYEVDLQKSEIVYISSHKSFFVITSKVPINTNEEVFGINQWSSQKYNNNDYNVVFWNSNKINPLCDLGEKNLCPDS